MAPTAPGTYKMAGSVEIASDIQLDFKAKGLMTAKEMRWKKNESFGEGIDFDGKEIDVLPIEACFWITLKIHTMFAFELR